MRSTRPDGKIQLVGAVSQMKDLAEVVERTLKIPALKWSFDETIAYIERFLHKERSKSASKIKEVSGSGA
jgi:vacuolar-type H+-ATPase catalytic subunit A/Vma1